MATRPGAALLGEFTEVESGQRADRPQLAAALALARRRRATLVIAKLDRLARSVAFIAGLMEGGAPFLACDNPHATPLTIHILAAVAQHEREAISARTKAALAVAKARGTRLGNPDGGPARVLAAAANRAGAARRAEAVRPLAERLASEGLSLRAVARELEERRVPTPRGGRWHAASVRALLARA
ncbi:recombinase family protein [Paeniroseomonas aquatica]|uniref:recombinase family protein n=1 Tax=Paeniroseomonas aquatica TaxID=373043 RepID=UPI0036110046